MSTIFYVTKTMSTLFLQKQTYFSMSLIQKLIRDELNTKEPFTNMNKGNYVRWILMLLENSSLICKKKNTKKV